MGTAEWLVVVLVVGARLALPFTIPYYPLPGAIACLVLDAADQSIFQKWPAIPLDGYQSYDKALDIYYLAIIYLSTLRNWTSPWAFRTSFFLYYYRLIGVVAFEVTHLRALLFVFPNTFEYFFDFIEGVRLRWDWKRVGKWTAIVSAAVIWVVIKLPQEWWIHIAQLDMTDFMKESLFGVGATDSWASAVGNRPLVLVAMIAAVVTLLAVAYLVITRLAPPKDRRLQLRADPLPVELRGPELYRVAQAEERLFDRALIEKIVLTGLVSVIFSLMLEVATFKLVFVAAFIVVNAMVSQWLARRGRSWKTVAAQMATMLVVNYAIVAGLLTLEVWLGRIGERTPRATTLFFVFLFTVITVLFDRYRTVFTARGVLTSGTPRGNEPGMPAAPLPESSA